MVAQKPKPQTSVDNNNAIPPAIKIQGVGDDVRSPTDSEMGGGNVWGDTDTNQRYEHNAGNSARESLLDEVPAPLRPGTAPKSPFDTQDENPWNEPGRDTTDKPKITLEHTPTVLRPGGKMETNPFKRKPLSNSSTPTKSDTATPTLGSSRDPSTEAFSSLAIDDSESNTNPWKPVIDDTRPSSNPPPIPPLARQESENNIWGTAGAGQSVITPSGSSPTPVALPSGRESPAWDEVDRTKPSLGSMPQQSRGRSAEEQEFSQDAHAWDDLGALDKGKAPAVNSSEVQGSAHDEWNLVDHDHDASPAAPALSRQSTWENFVDGDEQGQRKETVTGTAYTSASERDAADPDLSAIPPDLPPRQSLDVPPPQPPRPNTPSAANKTETYQIKNINWHDAGATPNARKSPILVQNANGPCPLVALVNALTLTTPADLPNTVLVQTLRSREQISLGLLLEAVFDELMSPRRTKSDVALPDVTELYGFLKGLHTGMNVNPRYVPTPELINTHKRNSTHVHPSERDDLIPGTFEDTRDMKLYATFSIPLMHGWLPPKDDPVYDAFGRQASSYDEVQNLMFREEELEDKLSNTSSGLTEQEQQLYQDILTIRSWLNSSATQLTQWGLNIVTKAIQPGTFAILFRNDHFSTLYRHPQTQQLFTLVTDAGYYTHDEIVWESLVDVKGERSEFLSGDFRLVGGLRQEQSQDVPGAWYADDESGTANHRGNTNPAQADPPGSPMSAGHEQEDRDLALALQLQEEEDERHRNEQAARRRETQLSVQFLEQQGRGITARTGPRRTGSSLAPARTSSTSVNNTGRGGGSVARGGRSPQQVRPLVPPPTTTHRPANAEEDDAPPSYEQASKAQPYVPPTGHPNHPGSSASSATDARRRPTLPGNAGTQPPPAQAGPSTPLGMGRGRPVVSHQQSASAGRDKDCVVM